MLEAVPKVVGEGPAEEWRFAMKILWESGFRIADLLDFSWDNIEVWTLADLARNVLPSHRVARVTLVCALASCGKEFDESPSHAPRRRHCSDECRRIASRKFDVSVAAMKQMIWEMPTTHIAGQFGVSDKAIEKFCKKHLIEKPPRGYWARMYAGQRDPSVD